MGPKITTPLFLAGLLAFTASEARAKDEPELIAILQSNVNAVEKCEACKQLRLVGTAKSVPALAALLGDERISQAARFALEGMATPIADTALRDAVGQTSGLLKAGVIDSLGWRRDVTAVGLLKPLLADEDAVIASTAAAALGRMGGPEALTALKTARDQAPPTVRPAAVEALLRCAEQLLAEGQPGQAEAIYRLLFTPSEEEHIRVAAYAGMIRSAGNGGLALLTSALKGNDTTAQFAALQLAEGTPNPEATKVFAALLPKTEPALQIALLTHLQRRGDDAALPAVLAAAGGSNAAVRAAALAALGELGDAGVVPLLAEAAIAGDAAEQEAARQALVVLHRGDIPGALVTQLHKSTPATQVELARAVKARAEKAAVDALLQLARSDQPAPRQAALQALGSLVDGNDLNAFVQLLVEAKGDDARSEIAGLFESLADRGSGQSPLEVEPIIRGLSGGDLETRKALLQVSALFVDERLRSTFRLALNDSDGRIHAAAARALCDARDVALLPDLVEVARHASDASLRALAIKGIVRLATDESAELPVAQRTETLTTAYGLASRVEDKRQVLSGLTRVPHATTLKLAEQARVDVAVQAEAELACFQIAQKLNGADSDAAKATLAQLATSAGNVSVRSNAQVLLRQLNSGGAYLKSSRPDR